MSEDSPDHQADELRRRVRGFVQRFGLLEASTRTPCGHNIATTDAHALIALRERALQTPDDPPAIRWLVERLCIDKSYASRACKRLEAAGLLKTVMSPEDARRRLLTLTEAGEARADRIDASCRARFVELIERLGPDVDQVVTALARLEHALLSCPRGEG